MRLPALRSLFRHMLRIVPHTYPAASSAVREHVRQRVVRDFRAAPVHGVVTREVVTGWLVHLRKLEDSVPSARPGTAPRVRLRLHEFGLRLQPVIAQLPTDAEAEARARARAISAAAQETARATAAAAAAAASTAAGAAATPAARRTSAVPRLQAGKRAEDDGDVPTPMSAAAATAVSQAQRPHAAPVLPRKIEREPLRGPESTNEFWIRYMSMVERAAAQRSPSPSSQQQQQQHQQALSAVASASSNSTPVQASKTEPAASSTASAAAHDPGAHAEQKRVQPQTQSRERTAATTSAARTRSTPASAARSQLAAPSRAASTAAAPALHGHAACPADAATHASM